MDISPVIYFDRFRKFVIDHPNIKIYNRNIENVDQYVCMTINKKELQELVDFIILHLEHNIESRESNNGNQFIRKDIKFAGLRNGKIVEFSNDKLSLCHDHIDQIIEIELEGA